MVQYTTAYPTGPRVSVVIPAYNASSYIERTLDSVFAQTLTSYEIVLVDDGSEDSEELERILKRYDAVRYVRNEHRGAAAARNQGIQMARGEWVAFLDADDYWTARYLEGQMEVLQQSSADVVYCDAFLVADGRVAKRTYMDLAPTRCAVSPESLLAVDVGIITSGVIARKTLLDSVGGFDETITRGQDFELWFRLAKNRAMFVCNRMLLLYYTLSETGLSGNESSQVQRTLELLKIIEQRGGLTANELDALRRSRDHSLAELAVIHGKDAMLRGEFSRALEDFTAAKKLAGGWKLSTVCLALRTAPQVLQLAYRMRKLIR